MNEPKNEFAAKKRARQRTALVKTVFGTPSTIFSARELRYLMEQLATSYAFAVKRETGQMPGTESEIGQSILVIARATYRTNELEDAIPELKLLAEGKST